MMTKKLSTATTPLCFGFFRCRVDVLQSLFSRSTISFAEFNCLLRNSLRSKRFRLVLEQRKTEERDSRFWPREK